MAPGGDRGEGELTYATRQPSQKTAFARKMPVTMMEREAFKRRYRQGGIF